MEEDNRMNVLAPEVAKVDELDKNNLRVVLEPFERGFGYTIGHSLRRIMLSYMPGAAITEVKIDGVSHEYGTIEGIKEDILDVLLNLKDLAIKLDGPAEAELKLAVKTPKTIIQVIEAPIVYAFPRQEISLIFWHSKIFKDVNQDKLQQKNP